MEPHLEYEVTIMPHYQRIRDLREDADLKQKQLCALLRCSQQTYSDYECGKTDIPTEALILLADFYNTSTDYLLGRTNNPLPLFDLPN